MKSSAADTTNPEQPDLSESPARVAMEFCACAARSLSVLSGVSLFLNLARRNFLGGRRRHNLNVDSRPGIAPSSPLAQSALSQSTDFRTSTSWPRRTEESSTLRPRGYQVEDSLRDLVIVHNDFGGPQQLSCLRSKKVGTSRSGVEQINFPRQSETWGCWNWQIRQSNCP